MATTVEAAAGLSAASTKTFRAKHRDIREPLTNRIAGILDEYPDGTQIARELLQNSDDARSTVQWYLLDHCHHFPLEKEDRAQLAPPQQGSAKLKLLHEDMHEYMGPALLSGSDSLFEEKDFKSMMNLAASEKRGDETKIGQMGIGFNSIYHLTDFPSFITGSDMMVIDPHERILNGQSRDLPERAASYDFVEDGWGLNNIPDQLKAFSVLEDIDFSKPYPGTIFRFPLRTPEQAKTSLLSKKAYTVEKVLEMLMMLKDEALKGILFLKHIEKVIIYERKELGQAPTKLYEIEIVNAQAVRDQRQLLLSRLKSHVHPDESASRDDILEYTVRAVYKISTSDSPPTEEAWQITTLIGNVLRSHEHMVDETGGDLSSHKLIPWVGIAAPSAPGVMIDSSRLFCFLPIGIKLPFPVHINGHFAVKHSRREIWTNQDNDFAKDAAANIKSVWNIHLFHTHIPVVYAKFLANMGLERGPSYDLWPLACGEGLGIGAIWKDLLVNLLEVVCRDGYEVFFCQDEEETSFKPMDYRSCWIAGRDIEAYPRLLKTLQELCYVCVDLPDEVLQAIPDVVESLELDNKILSPSLVRSLLFDVKDRWSSTVSRETRMEMLEYCMEDGDIEDLEGLPLLPLVGDFWVEFSKEEAESRYLVDMGIFKTLSYSADGLVDITIKDKLVEAFRQDDDFMAFWRPITVPIFCERIHAVFSDLLYKDQPRTLDSIEQPTDSFPTEAWLKDFWSMVCGPENIGAAVLQRLVGLHIVPITQRRLAPLAEDYPVAYIDRTKHSDEPTLEPFMEIMDKHLGCRVLREDAMIREDFARGFVFELSNANKVLEVMSRVPSAKLQELSQEHRATMCRFMARWLSAEEEMDQERQETLRRLPVFQTYDLSKYVPLQNDGVHVEWRVAHHFSHAENPWEPTALGLLAHEQPMLKHLTNLLDVPWINESTYWKEVLTELDQHPEEQWDAMIVRFCGMYHVHSKEHDFTAILRDKPFVRVSGPRSSHDDLSSAVRLSPRSTVHRSFASLFLNDELMFPCGVYIQPAVFSTLEQIGLLSTFDAEFATERITSLAAYAQSRGITLVEPTLTALYSRLNSDFSDSFQSDSLRDAMETKSWILARIRGDGDGDGESADLQLCSSTECRPETDLPLVGSTMPLATHHFTNPLMLTYIGWDLPPPLANVLEHFQGILSACFRDDGAAVRPDEVAFIAIYRNLQDRVCSSDCLSAIKGALDNKPWILINGTLHTVERVAFNMSFDLSPHFVKITTPGLDTLFRAMGVREQILAEDLMSVMSAVADGYGKDESVSDTDQELLVKLLNGIVFNTAFQWSPNILIPTMDGRLCKIADVVFDDVNARNTRSDVWGIEGGEQGQEDGPSSLQYTFASPLITLLLADKLHIPMFSTKSWDDQRDSTFEPWAQEEKIVDRIKNILNDYDPASIFTEFLQNAADAGATECTFMLDQRSFGKTKVLSKGMAAWQGPALVIYNDAVFTESDFEGLSNIGVGNKRDDLSKIGRHGLGFNSVFHFTDVPSVVSGDYIGFFDPKKTYLPKSRTSRGLLSHGGQRCNFLKLKGDALEEQLAPYQGLFGCDMKSHFPGTIFRIPLRTLDVMTDLQEGSKIGEEWTLSQIKEMLESWSEDAKVGMLFLDTVKTIELTDSRDFTWTATKAIAKIKPSLAASLQDGNSGSASTRVVDITTHSSRHAEKQLQTWLIYTDSDFPADTIHTVGDFAQKHGWSAHRGIAIPVIQGSKTAFRGRLFAHLPTTIETGFRFHLHAGFALTSSRKSLAGGSDKGNPQTVWNDFLLQDCLPCTATDAFTKLYIYQLWDILHGKPKSIDTDQAIENYFRLWPVRNQCPQMEPFRINFSKLAYARPILPCRTSRQPSDVMPLMGQNVAFPGLEGAPVGMVQMIHRILQEKYVSICVCPHSVMIQLRTDWKSDSSFKFTSVNEDYVRKLIRNDPEFVPKYVKTVEDKRWLLEYTLKALLDPLKTQQMQEPIVELALLPLMNGEWKHMDPSTGCHTASADVRELISGRDVLVDESLFKTTVSLAQAGENIRMSPLESIFKKLTMTSTYGITPLSNAQFVSIFLAENPLGVPEDKKERLWRYLNKFQSLEPFGDIPLLETVGGRMVPLKEIHAALDLSKADHWPKQHLQRLATLLSEQGHIIIDSYQNKRHPFLLETSLKPDDVMVLKKISKICQNWPENRVLTKEEAETIRTMVMEASDDFRPHVAPLGILKIWPSWGAVGSNNEPPRICARGSFFTQGTFSLKDLGSNPDVIMTQYCKHFATMGARSLGVVKAASTRVLPKFQNGALKCTRSIKEAYMRMLSEIIKLATPGGKKADSTAKAYLVSAKSILARDGTFCASSTLYDPDDPLLSTVFAGVQSKFPDPMLWSHVQHKKHLFAFRNSSNSTVIRECAMHIMTMAAVSPADTITPATALVKHIYEHPGGVRWMDPQWKIVPAEVIQDSPQNEHAPVFPALMSFSELVHAASRDICWTQCAFFPVSLQPSVTFKGLFGNVGEPNVTQIVRHLGALSGDLALKWITTDHQLLLKMSLFKVYEALNLVATKDDASMEIVSQALRNNLAKPYILNGKDSDPSLPESWFWPAQLMLDIDNDIDRFHVVHKSMYAYRDFLVAAGVDQMQAVVGSLQVPDGRRVGEIEQRLYNCWVTQDEHNGFMDVRFKFAARQQILAHKFMLVHANDYFLRRFTGAWAEYTTRDKDAPGVEVIDLAKQEESYEAFWGLLHYFYTDQLIPSNGPPIAAAIMTQQEPNDDDSAPSIASASGSKSKQQRADELRDRLEFLMNLQRLANMYETPRLKALIACEVMARHVIHSNVFSVRAHAALNQSKEVQEHCDMFLRKNVTSVRRYLHGELQAYRGMLATLTSEDDGQQRAEIKDEIAELETNLRELNNLA